MGKVVQAANKYQASPRLERGPGTFFETFEKCRVKVVL
jgi:hypothetical protein